MLCIPNFSRILFAGLGLSAFGWILSASEWTGILELLLSVGLFGIYRFRMRPNSKKNIRDLCLRLRPG
ncbi:hypothetical protein CH371_19255 [Leptospira wolffii]|uniref:Uncharacterized protein n=2 Tax=Leptospira wolffii TaxID=409998 RepID=A0A2M9Z7F5_9LEPT|nr:hypothetical protein CH371_19255 [Leptospira wolffii]